MFIKIKVLTDRSYETCIPLNSIFL